MNRDNVRVVERGDCPRLALESGEPFGVTRQVRRQHLERHIAPEFRVVGAIHLAHSSFADLGEDLVMADAVPDHKCLSTGARYGFRNSRINRRKSISPQDSAIFPSWIRYTTRPVNSTERP